MILDHIDLPFVKMSPNAVTPTRATEGSNINLTYTTSVFTLFHI